MAIDPINFARTTQVRLRRGTTAQIAANPPVEAEPFYDATEQRMGIGGGSDGIVQQWKSQFLEHTADATDAVARNLQEKLTEENKSLLDFGADPTGVEFCDDAFDKFIAASQGKTVTIPPGTYKIATTKSIISENYTRIRGNGKVTILFTGTGNAIEMDAGSSLKFQMVELSGVTIQGNANCTNALYSRGIVRSKIDVEVRDCTTGIMLIWNVLNEIRVVCSSDIQAFVKQPDYGIVLDERNPGEQSAANTFINPIIEGVKTGIYLKKSLENNFFGGTSEGNEIGLLADSGAEGDCFYGIYFELNSTRSIDISGGRITFYDVKQNSGSIGIVRSGATNTRFFGGFVPAVDINSGAVNTLISGCQSQNITDNGTNTMIFGVKDNLSNNFLGGKLPNGFTLGGLNQFNFLDVLTYSPQIIATSGSPAGYIEQVGHYLKINRYVFFGFRIIISGPGTLSGGLQISLPVSSATSGGFTGSASIASIAQTTLSAGNTQILINIPSSSNGAFLSQFGTGLSSTLITEAALPVGAWSITGFGFYEASS